ncbi:MAG: HAMP domain-containing histidine kinase [Rhizobiaceae bacterium]|nr:HAMP domain-containing histidine kinase [Rhizobiaceae bacterium]
MSASSLRLRLLAGAAIWIVLALLVAGGTIALLFIDNVERNARAGMSASLARLVAALEPEGVEASRLDRPLSDPRYEIPLSGIYWQVEDAGRSQTTRSRSLWDFVLQPGDTQPEEGEQFEVVDGPAGQTLSALTLAARFNDDGGSRVLNVTVAQDRATLDASIRQFGFDLALALGILAAVLILAAWAQVSLGLSPLGRLRGDVEKVRRNSAEKVADAYPAEVQPLVAEVNELLAAQQKSLEFARRRASDLAHGLKTPLSVLETVAQLLRRTGDTENAVLVEDLTAEMAERIDYQMRLSRLRQRTRLHVFAASLPEIVRRTAAVLKKTPDGERLDWQIDIDDALYVDIDRNDLIELMGVLLENAARWAKSKVRVSARNEAGHIAIEIADDGKGASEERLFRKGGEQMPRMDEDGGGNGLGIAIAREIVLLNGGSIDFTKAPEGGLLVSISISPAEAPAEPQAE